MDVKTIKLGNVASVKGGKRLPKGVSLVADRNTHPYIRVRDLNNKRTLELDDNFEYVDDETQKSISRYTVECGDIVLSIVGTIGLVTIVGKSLNGANLTENCVKINQLKGVDRDFLYYYLKSEFGQDEIKCGTVGAVQAKLPIKNILTISIDLPPLETQRKIAAILSALDDKIELNRRVNANLEEQATAIYAKFFPYETTDALPEGWRVGTVGEIVEIHDSKRVPLSAAERMKMENKKFPYYGAASLMDYVEDYLFDGKYLLLGEDGTVVDAKGGPILQYVWGKFWVNNHAHVLTGKLGFNTESLMLLFKQTYVKPIVTGAVQPKISQANLRSLPIIVPPMERLNYFNDKVASLFTQYRVNEEQNKILTTVRDALLPRLMSGEINVSDVSL